MKKSKRKTNLKSSILVLLLLAVMLVVSTYAWFTANRTVTVSELDVNVDAKNGLQISADATNWKSLLQLSDLTGATYVDSENLKNQIPTVMEPTSSAGDLDADGHLVMYSGEVNADTTVGSPTQGQYLLTSSLLSDGNSNGELSTGRYITFDMYLKVQIETQIYLTTSSNVIFKDAASKGLENAARVAFVIEGTKPDGTTPGDIQAQKVTTASGDNMFLWEPNVDSHTAQGIENGRSLYGSAKVAGLTAGAGNAQVAYDAVKAPITTGIALAKTTATASADNFAAMTPKFTTNTTQEAGTAFMKLPAGITKIRTYMWVEGQDIDCENSASGAALGFNLQLSMDNT